MEFDSYNPVWLFAHESDVGTFSAVTVRTFDLLRILLHGHARNCTGRLCLYLPSGCKRSWSVHHDSKPHRKQRYVCKDCGRQFVENPPNKRTPQQLWDMVDKLLLEKIPIAGISRMTEISDMIIETKGYTCRKC